MQPRMTLDAHATHMRNFNYPWTIHFFICMEGEENNNRVSMVRGTIPTACSSVSNVTVASLSFSMVLLGGLMLHHH
jgi:hypothetical protein